MKLEESKLEPQWKGWTRFLSPLVALGVASFFTIGFFGFTHSVASASTGCTKSICCTIDGRAYVGVGQYPVDHSSWAPSRFLWITLGFGQFSFAAAKSIDVAWDLIIGRGGQLLLIYLTYPIIRRAFLRAIVQFPVYLPMYTSITFDKLSLSTTWASVQPFPEGVPSQPIDCPAQADARHLSRVWHSWVILPLLAYIMAFPTILSAMTGYQSGLEPYVIRPGSEGDLMKASLLKIPAVVVFDGSRIGLTDDVAGYGNETWYKNVSECMFF